MNSHSKTNQKYLVHKINPEKLKFNKLIIKILFTNNNLQSKILNKILSIKIIIINLMLEELIELSFNLKAKKTKKAKMNIKSNKLLK